MWFPRRVARLKSGIVLADGKVAVMIYVGEEHSAALTTPELAYQAMRHAFIVVAAGPTYGAG